jgi:hypothetical protein
MDEMDEVLKQLSEVKPRKEDTGAFWIGAAFALIALCFPAYQTLLWLQSGYWTPLPISDAIQLIGWRVPVTDWAGVQRIINWIFDLPMWSIPAFLAFGAFSAWNESK